MMCKFFQNRRKTNAFDVQKLNLIHGTGFAENTNNRELFFMKTKIINLTIACISLSMGTFAQNSQLPDAGADGLSKPGNVDPRLSNSGLPQSDYSTNRSGHGGTNGFGVGNIPNGVSRNLTNGFGRMTNEPVGHGFTNKLNTTNNIGAYGSYTNYNPPLKNAYSDNSNRSSTYKNPYAVDPRTIGQTGAVTN
jgi:hypothetical protein